MDMDISVDGSSLKMTIIGAVDTEGGSELTMKFVELAKDQNIKNAEIDMGGVPTITSAGIGKLLTFFKTLDQRGGKMKITDLSESLRKQFKEIHLDQIITIDD